MIVPPRGIRNDNDDEIPMISGHADATAPVYDLEGDEQEALAAEVREQLRRKRPCGFAPWPDTTQ